MLTAARIVPRCLLRPGPFLPSALAHGSTLQLAAAASARALASSAAPLPANGQEQAPTAAASVDEAPSGSGDAGHPLGGNAVPSTAPAGRRRRVSLPPLPEIRHRVLPDEAPSSSSSSPGISGSRGGRKGSPASSSAADASDQSARQAAANVAAAAEEEEVRAVFAKLVGGMTKSGHKARAQRIVLDAMRLMHKHLQKGTLEEIK